MVGVAPEAKPSARVRDRVHTLRSAAGLGSLPSLFVLVYAACTWSAPNRPAMVVVAGVLLAMSSGIWGAAPRLVGSRLRQPVNIASVVVHLCGYALFAYLDGGVTSPLGPLVWVGLAFQAVSVPYRPLAGFGVVALTGYGLVAVLGPPTAPSYPIVYTLGFLGLTALCARHARSLASLRSRLADVARIDPLTGCLNRRGFDERLAQEQSKADRSGRPFALVLVDLDAFKAVNDTHGHQVGDALLGWTARTLEQVARSGDVVGRVGGDEFAVILVDVGPDEADALVARLRDALDGSSPASLGVACYPAEATDDASLRHLADSRVYADKARRADRLPPVPGAVPTAIAVPLSGTDQRVSAVERRRESIADLGRIGLLNFGIALVHLVLFRPDATNRGGLLLASATGVAIGLTMLVVVGTVARSKQAGTVMSVLTPFYYGSALVITVLDGGVSSLYFIGTITPLPIIALTTPRKRAVPIAAAVLAGAVAQAVLLPSPGVWYVVVHLVSVTGIAVVCGIQGAAAAGQRKLLTRLSMVDSLTDRVNRRGFEERFGSELARVRRQGGTLSLLVLDLDGFKQVNDTLGHAAGDELLCWVADTVEDTVRAHDVVGRLGGDEFVVLLTDCPADHVAVITDRMRERLAARTAASIGAAVLGADGEDFDSLYRHADTGLYAEKAARRAATKRPCGAPEHIREPCP